MTQVAFITGSSRGIGLAIAKRLAAKDYQVILNGVGGVSDEVLAEFSDFTHEPYVVLGDVSDFDKAKEMIDEVVGKFGQIDVLVNNAGINRDGMLMRMSEEDYDFVMDINLKGTFNMCRHVARTMMKQRSGSIINMSSVSGIMGNAGQANYSASKAGVVGLTKSIARELAGRGITVNAIAPGFIETDMTDQMGEKHKEKLLELIPLKRYGNVDEIAMTVEFLIDNKYITGQTITVDGGLYI